MLYVQGQGDGHGAGAGGGRVRVGGGAPGRTGLTESRREKTE